MERVTVGTGGIDCTVRLRRDLFFESIQIEFVKESGGWRATCSDNIYIPFYGRRYPKIYDAESDPRRHSWKSGIRNQKDLYLELIFRSILTAVRISRCERMINLDRYQTISIGNNSAYEIRIIRRLCKERIFRLTQARLDA